MSARNHKKKQAGQSQELLSELTSLRDLLGSDALGDIPLLDQIAEAGKPEAAKPAPLAPPARDPLSERDLPILFSPLDEEPAEDYKAELSEAERELLRPLNELPAKAAAVQAPDRPQAVDQQPGLFDNPPAAAENPFLPAHIRARLTGGQVPKSEPAPEAAPAEVPAPAEETPEPQAESVASDEKPEPKSLSADQRQQLIDRLVAKQLPELERQLRERIARMLDELEAKR